MSGQYFLQVAIFFASIVVLIFEAIEIVKELKKPNKRILRLLGYVVTFCLIGILGVWGKSHGVVSVTEEFSLSKNNVKLIGDSENICLYPSYNVNKPVSMKIKDTWVYLQPGTDYVVDKQDNSVFINFIYLENKDSNRQLANHGLRFTYDTSLPIFHPTYLSNALSNRNEPETIHDLRFKGIITDIPSIGIIIIAPFLLSTLCLLIYFIIKTKEDTTRSIQLLGVLSILSICVITDNFLVQISCVFIIATLITELEFLTHLAAIIFGRKEYWPYAIRKADKVELDRKRESDMLQEEEVKAPLDSSEMEHRMSEFVAKHDKVAKLLISSDNGLFLRHHMFKKEMVIDTKEGKRYHIDLMAEGPGYWTYLIDITLTKKPTSLMDSISNLSAVKTRLNTKQQLLRTPMRARSLLVTYDIGNLPNAIGGVHILKYDEKSNTFTNLETIRNWVYHTT